MLLSSTGFAVLTYPLFLILLSGVGMVAYIIILAMFAVLLAAYTGPAAAMCVELVPTRYRAKWSVIGYGLSGAVFGGFTPFIATWLISRTGYSLAPALYVVSAALVGVVCISRLRETAFDDL
ncbi:hypothetical protein [Pseudomonas amygdali]|uniref:hypothetical protein n=1 Tax=Pseudomonas amygdali TaxID=47877 RepID=UPI0034D6E74C